MLARKKQEKLDNQKLTVPLKYARLRYKLFSTEEILKASQYLASKDASIGAKAGTAYSCVVSNLNLKETALARIRLLRSMP